MAGSEASLSLEDDINGPGDNNSVIPTSNQVEQVKRRKRWTFMLKRKGDDASKTRFKALTVSCRCKGAIKGSCLIVAASFVELIGNLVALYFGVSFILNAHSFYSLDNNPATRQKEYDEQLKRVLFLEKYRVGFVALLAICVMGCIVSFMMGIGTIYKSWKSMRTSMSLLFSMCFSHVFILSAYLYESDLVYTATVIPFRMYEIFLLYSYIQYYKKKKLEEIRSGRRKVCGTVGQPGQSSKDCIDTTSLISFSPDGVPIMSTAPQFEKKSSEVQVTFDIAEGNIINPTLVVPENIIMDAQTLGDIESAKSTKKRTRGGLFRAWPRKKKAAVHYAPRIPERYIDYK